MLIKVSYRDLIAIICDCINEIGYTSFDVELNTIVHNQLRINIWDHSKNKVKLSILHIPYCNGKFIKETCDEFFIEDIKEFKKVIKTKFFELEIL